MVQPQSQSAEAAHSPRTASALCGSSGQGQGEYQEKVIIAAKGFLKLGLERYHSVCILGFNSEQWFVADLAAIHAGGYAVGIYTTHSAEACFQCLELSRANICVLQDKKQLAKILSIRGALTNLKAIVQWEGEIDTSVPDLLSWDQFMELGKKDLYDTTLNTILQGMSVNECCTLVFASGTVGPPKAVMLSHDNLIWDAFIVSKRCGELDPEKDRIVSYLPLSHIAAQLVDIYISLSNAIPVYFAKPDALKGTLIETLRDVYPTRFVAIPRVWEKIHATIMAESESSGKLKKKIVQWARNQGMKHNLKRIEGYEEKTLGYKLARALVFKKVHRKLGLDKCTTFVSTAAPLTADIREFFLSLDIPIMDAFGMSECAGAHSFSTYPKCTLDSSGEVLEGVGTKFGGSKSKYGPGEIFLRGRHVFMGYLNEPEKTEAAIDEEGWLHSGDIGRLDKDKLLYFTGRIKELLVMAGGETIVPTLIELIVQSELTHIRWAVLVGDQKPFLSILLTLKSKIDPRTGEPLDELELETQKWVENLGSNAKTVSEIIETKDPLVYKAIETGIDRANKKAISKTHKIKKFVILPRDLSLFTGELGPTFKLKRNVVYDNYKDVIEDMYKE